MLDFLMNPGVITGVLVGALILVIVLTGYVKASPDTAYIISGLRKQPKVLIGKAGIKIPFLEKKDELNLQLIPIDVKTSSAVPTADYININVDAAVNVKISDNSERLGLAAQNFLNKRVDYIANVADDFLHKSSMLKIEINKIIEDEGNVEDGKKKLEITNEHYVGLMDGVTKIEFDKVPLSLLNDIDVQINDMIAIKKIIKEGD